MALGVVKPLHEILLAQKVITPDQVRHLQSQAAQAKQPLCRLVVQQGLLPEDKMARLIADQAGTSYIDLEKYEIQNDVIQLIPESVARRFNLVPIRTVNGSITVAMENPMDTLGMHEVRMRTKRHVEVVVASRTHILQACDRYYGTGDIRHEVAEAIAEALRLSPSDREAAAESPMMHMIELLVRQAMEEHASDIHIEPSENGLRTRFRIDGLLHEVKGPPLNLHSAVTSCIKVLANLDIAEKRKPQDGRFWLQVGGTRWAQKKVDIRVSTVPTEYGEHVVMRLLDRSTALLPLAQLGIDEMQRTQLEQLVQLPHGMLLVTGPTGAGKTTTLYAALNLINAPDKHIITIEDPIEYQIEGVTQVQVNVKADVTFATALRSFVRQDPNVMMVGEIRDRETAETAIQSALTGHLVLSTLHTNDAASALTRLVDMGIEPFLVASSVVGVVAQRLVRCICEHCKESYTPPENLAREVGLEPAGPLYRGRGCAQCKQSGYTGRVCVTELLPMSDAIKDKLVGKEPAHSLRDAARKAGMRTLWEDGLIKVAAGVTSLDEILRASQQH